MRWKKAALENCPGVPCVVTPPAPSFTCGTSTISDYDGNDYNTVSIGTKCWTTTNLKVTKYNDGTNIPEIPGSGTWDNTIVTGARTVYEVSGTPVSGYVGNYGYLYNWYAAADVRKICPTGWHVPTDGEWTSLIKFIDPTASATGTQSTTAGGKLKSTSLLWNSGSPGTDNYGFSALPGGYRGFTGTFFDIGDIAMFWSTTESEFSASNAYYRYLYTFFSVERSEYGLNSKTTGLSIRCIKD